MQDIVIRGSGGHAQEVAYLIDRINEVKPTWNLLGYIDVKDIGTTKYEYQVLGDEGWFKDKKNMQCIIAIADPASKYKVYEELQQYELHYPNIIDPGGKMGKNLKIGKGNIVLGSVSLSINNEIGDFCLLNGLISIGHDTRMNNFVSVMPFTSIAGNVEIDERVFVGSGATIIQGVKIGKEATVGAGSVVIRKVKEGNTVFGNPAKTVYQKVRR